MYSSLEGVKCKGAGNNRAYVVVLIYHVWRRHIKGKHIDVAETAQKPCKHLSTCLFRLHV